VRQHDGVQQKLVYSAEELYNYQDGNLLCQSPNSSVESERGAEERNHGGVDCDSQLQQVVCQYRGHLDVIYQCGKGCLREFLFLAWVLDVAEKPRWG